MVKRQEAWKYSTLGLLAILAISLSIPQAAAHITNNAQHMLTHIYNLVDGIEAKTDNLPTDPADQSLIDTQLASIQSDTDDIQGTLDTLSGGDSNPKAVRMDFSADPPNSNDPADSIKVEILPYVDGVIYAGHIKAEIRLPPGPLDNLAGFNCFTGGNATHELLPVVVQFSIVSLDTDFICDRIQFEATELEDFVDADPVHTTGVVLYSENSIVTEVND